MSEFNAQPSTRVSLLCSPSDGLYVINHCRKNGTWSTHPKTKRQWTDYSPCILGKFEVGNRDFDTFLNLFGIDIILFKFIFVSSYTYISKVSLTIEVNTDHKERADQHSDPSR